MKRIIATTLGVILTSSTLTVFAAKQDRQNLDQCKADISSYYGDGARARLRSIQRGTVATQMRLMVKTPEGGTALVVCSVSKQGISSLANQDGIALTGLVDEQRVSRVAGVSR